MKVSRPIVSNIYNEINAQLAPKFEKDLKAFFNENDEIMVESKLIPLNEEWNKTLRTAYEQYLRKQSKSIMIALGVGDYEASFRTYSNNRESFVFGGSSEESWVGANILFLDIKSKIIASKMKDDFQKTLMLNFGNFKVFQYERLLLPLILKNLNETYTENSFPAFLTKMNMLLHRLYNEIEIVQLNLFPGQTLEIFEQCFNGTYQPNGARPSEDSSGCSIS